VPNVACSVLLAGLVLASACAKPASKREVVRDDDSEEPDSRPKKKRAGLEFDAAPTLQTGAAPRPTLSFEPAPSVKAPPPLSPEVDFLSSGASRIVTLLERRVVRPRFVEVVVRHDRVDVDVVTGPDAVQQYQLKGEGVMDRGLDTIKSRRGKELGRAEFGAADVDWAKLPSVARDALDRLPGAQVSHVFIERPLPFSQDVLVRVFLAPGGWVDYDARGRFLATHASP
jgi:hypothetical protein